MEMSLFPNTKLCVFFCAASVLTVKSCYFFAPLNVEVNPALAWEES